MGIRPLRNLQRLISQLNRSTDLSRTLQAVVDGVVSGLGFGAAVVNLVREDGALEVVAAAGSDDLGASLLGRVGKRTEWDATLSCAQSWGTLRFIAHENDGGQGDGLPSWVPAIAVPSDPAAWHPLDALFAPLWEPDGELVGVLSVDLPVDGRRPGAEQRDLLEMYAAQAGIAIENARLASRLRAEGEALRESEELFRLAFEGAPIGMAISDLHRSQPGRYLRVNDALCTMLGYSREDLLQRSFLDIVDPDDRPRASRSLRAAMIGSFTSDRVERRYVTADGRLGWAAVSASVIRAADGTPLRMVTQVLDITERKNHELRLARQALHDPLTGLPNRLLLLQRLAHAVAQARRSGASAVVLFCDLDDFKEINDRYGHRAGDTVLIATADRLLRQVRAVDTVARFGGDEFVVLAEETTAVQGEELIHRLHGALAVAIPTDSSTLRITVSVGMATVTADTPDAEQVLQRADAAMYRAKRGAG